MIRYEALLLTVPEITADESKSIEQQITRLIENHQGTLISFERWGKYRLSYPVHKNDYGIYFLVRFECTQIHPLVDELKTLIDVKLHDLIMRGMITRLDGSGSLSYQRPQSLEEAPSREVGFFKERHPKSEELLASEAESDDEIEL